MALPWIAVTSGDPAGVGPELCLKIATHEATRKICRLALLGDASIFASVADRLDLPLPPSIPVGEFSTTRMETAGSPLVVDFGLLDPSEVSPGTVSAATGRASFSYIEQAIEWAMNRQVGAIVTGPIHKEALHAAGVPFPGHTEILADRTRAERHSMMLTSEDITCTVVTAHVGLSEVPELLTTEEILNAIELSNEALERMRGREVHLKVCGLNPHAGEGGLFGNREEETIIQPAIDQARRRGIDVSGPFPPDTAFLPMHRKSTDGYICMYHDQGLIPLKALAFDTGVNVTLGLPIVRTSVDHGTALDIAWQGKASVSSFIKAVELAVKLCTQSVQKTR